MSASLYLYAITPGTAPAPGLLGLQDAVLFTVVAGALAAVVSAFSGRAPQLDAASAWRHESVVEAVCRDGVTLPMRFGTLAGDEQNVQRLLREREDEFVTALATVSGRVELGLRVLWRTPPDGAAAASVQQTASPTSGREYLMSRQAAERRTQALRDAAQKHAQAVCRHLAGLAADSSVQVRPAHGLLLSAAFLVDREAADEFVAAVERLEGSQDSLHFLCTGPWPPYSFVGSRPDGGIAQLFAPGAQADRPAVTH